MDNVVNIFVTYLLTLSHRLYAYSVLCHVTLLLSCHLPDHVLYCSYTDIRGGTNPC